MGSGIIAVKEKKIVREVPKQPQAGTPIQNTQGGSSTKADSLRGFSPKGKVAIKGGQNS